MFASATLSLMYNWVVGSRTTEKERQGISWLVRVVMSKSTELSGGQQGQGQGQRQKGSIQQPI